MVKTSTYELGGGMWIHSAHNKIRLKLGSTHTHTVDNTEIKYIKPDRIAVLPILSLLADF